MKVILAAASFSPNISGLPRHAFNVARCLLQRPDISAVHLSVAPWQRNLVESADLGSDPRLTIHIAEMKASSLSRNRWYYCELPRLAARLQADVVHLTFPAPIAAGAFPCPTVSTLHDLYPYEIPSNFRFPQIIFNRIILRHCLRNAGAIACVSDATKSRLQKYVPTAWAKAVRIHNCVEAVSRRPAQSPIPGWKGEPFLLSIAQHRRNKNIPLLIRVFDRLLRARQIDPEMKLVIIGIPGPETPEIHRIVSVHGLTRHVHFLEGVSEAELQWCYARCEALAAPSITEGFGLPVAEALLVGCRVVCSDIDALREVGGNHCRFIDLRKDAEEAFAEGIVATLNDFPRSPVALPQFAAPVLAEQYVALYRRLIAAAALKQNAQLSVAIQAPTSEGQTS